MPLFRQNVLSITGTANQVIASGATGAVTLSLPQSIATTSNVQFGKVGLGISPSYFVDISSSVGIGDAQFRITDTATSSRSFFMGAQWINGYPTFGTNAAYGFGFVTNNIGAMIISEAQVIKVTSNTGAVVVRGTTEGTKHIDIFNGTAPVGTLVNGISLYSSGGEAFVMDAGGTATQFSPHDKEGNWYFNSKNTVTGKKLIIDVEKMLRKLNDKFGWDFVHDFFE